MPDPETSRSIVARAAGIGSENSYPMHEQIFGYVPYWQIVLQKFFCTGALKF